MTVPSKSHQIFAPGRPASLQTARPSLGYIARTLITPLALLCLLIFTLCAQAEKPPRPSVEEIEFFEAKVRPLLVEHCFECHSSKARNPRET